MAINNKNITIKVNEDFRRSSRWIYWCEARHDKGSINV